MKRQELLRLLAQQESEQEWEDPFDYSDPGTQLLAPGTRNSTWNSPRDIESIIEIMKMLEINRRGGTRGQRLRGLFGSGR